MMDFDTARQKMVDNQIRTEDVTGHALLASMLKVPRELFVAQEQQSLCYTDQAISLAPLGGEGRFMAKPATLAKLLQAAGLTGNEIVLIVGVGSGYSAAVCSPLAMSIVALEEVAELAEFATAALEENGYDNVAVVTGPLPAGFANEAPYDVIVLSGSVQDVPSAMFDQLSEGGRLVAVTGSGNSGIMSVFTRKDGLLCRTELKNCAMKALPGFEKEAEFVF